MASTKKQGSARNKPPKGRPQATSAIAQPETQGLSPLLSSFSPDASLFALVTLAFDKHRLRVYDTSSQRAIAEHTIASGRVTSLSWSVDGSLSPSNDVEMSSPDKKRKKKKTEQSSSEDKGRGENLVVLGLSDGTVSFFSSRHAKVVKTLSHATSTSAILAASVHPKHTSRIWTSSADSTLRLWVIPTSTIVSQIKNPNRLPYSSLSVGPSPNDLLAAHHQITHFTSEDQNSATHDLEEYASFTGHASPVRNLRWSKVDTTSSHFFSSAENDRFIYVWTTPEEASSSVKPTASISLDSDVREFVLLGTDASSREILAALSTSGRISIIPVPDQLPADSKKAHTLRSRVTIGNAVDKRTISSPPPLVSLTFKDSESVLVARLVKGAQPVFDLVRYVDDTGEFLTTVTLPEPRDVSAEDETQLVPNRRYGESSSVAVATGADLDEDGNEIGPEVEGMLDVDLAELSLGQRLMAVNDVNMAADSDDDDQATTQRSKSKKGGKSDLSSIPANSLTRTVIQALHSSDSRLLEMCLAHTDTILIQNTVQRLPPQLSVPLITACVERLGRGAKSANMKGRGGGTSSQRGTGLINWIKAVLAIHAGHLMAMPDLVARLSGLHSTLTARLNLYESLLSLNGRLDMVLSQIEMRSSKTPAALSLPGSKGKAGNSKDRARHYIEGESDASDAEEEMMEVEVDGDSEDEGSVEDIELGGDSESDDGEPSELDSGDDEDDGDSEENEFIDDEAEEDEDDEEIRGRNSQSFEPLLLENEREAVADLLQYLENRTTTNFFQGNPLAALTTLSFSDNVDLQRSAALAFAEITEKEVRPVARDTLDPILFLLSSHDTEVQRAASAALGNLAVNTDNKLLIVKLGGLEPLIRQMLSPNVEVQCNAVGCVTNLATHDDNKTKIAKSGALVPLTRLARSKDMRVQRNATGALLNMTHSDENRQQLVNAGAIPVLVSLLNSPDTDVQYYCTTALSNIAVDATNRKKLAQGEPKLVASLVNLMDSQSLKVQCQAALALRNLASDEKYQLEIVKADGLQPLLRLLQSTYLPLILSSAACVRNVSIHPQNESPIIEAGFLQPLIGHLSFKDNEEVQCHAISTLRNLAASSEKNKKAIVKAGAVQQIKELVLEVPITVQSEMTACVAVLALSDDLKGQLLEMGICEVLIPLTNSPSSEVQGNSAAALGNLSSKEGRLPTDDYSPFNDVWDKPDGGMHKYLHRFLTSTDATFQHIAVWTIVQLLESGDPQLISNIRTSPLLIPNIRNLSISRATSPTSSAGGTPRSHPSQHSYQDTETNDGQGEIQLLSRRILEFVDDFELPIVEGTSQASQIQPGSSLASSNNHEELRRSVLEALAPVPGSHR